MSQSAPVKEKRTGTLDRVLSGVESINERTGAIVLWLIPVMVLVVTYEVVARYGFNKPTIWAMETSQFLFCASIALGAGYTLLHDRHVRVDIVHNHLKVRVKALVNVITTPFILAFTGVLFWQTFNAAMESLINGERSASYWAPPVFPIIAIMTIGIVLMFIQALCLFARECITSITGQTGKGKETVEPK